jgi:hypothetical protein
MEERHLLEAEAVQFPRQSCVSCDGQLAEQHFTCPSDSKGDWCLLGFSQIPSKWRNPEAAHMPNKAVAVVQGF